MTVGELIKFFDQLTLDEHDQTTAERVLKEIRSRLGYLADVGLHYLTLDRLSATLSGGESQRINLSTSLGSNLVGSMYILDEPSIGLHPRDTNRLIGVLKQLRDLDNTVIVVEHEEEVMRAADWIVDMGPEPQIIGIAMKRRTLLGCLIAAALPSVLCAQEDRRIKNCCRYQGGICPFSLFRC